MINEDEIRLLGQPVKITIPGNAITTLQKYGRKYPELHGGKTYCGFVMCDIYGFNAYIDDIYIEIDNCLYNIADYNVLYYPLSDHIEEVQDEVTFSKIRKIALLLYKKLEKIEYELDRKVDRD